MRNLKHEDRLYTWVWRQIENIQREHPDSGCNGFVVELDAEDAAIAFSHHGAWAKDGAHLGLLFGFRCVKANETRVVWRPR